MPWLHNVLSSSENLRAAAYGKILELERWHYLFKNGNSWDMKREWLELYHGKRFPINATGISFQEIQGVEVLMHSIPHALEFTSLSSHHQDSNCIGMSLIEPYHLETPPTLDELNVMLSTADKVCPTCGDRYFI